LIFNEKNGLLSLLSSYYEKIGAETRYIDGEIPFEVPEGWEWCRLKSVIELYSGRDLASEDYNDKNQGIPYITGASNIDNDNIIVNRWTQYPVVLSKGGDLLISCKGTVGVMVFNYLGNIHIARQIMAIRALFIDIKFVKVFLAWYMPNLIQQAKSMIPGISREHILDALIPIPPVKEQNRITKQMQDVDNLILEHDKLEQQETQIQTEYPNNLKKSILQYAIQGRLVTQNPNDEPASVLLEKIRKEKELLIKAGKLKRDKTESYINVVYLRNSYNLL
jgi:type I restriction enzyme S subunit